MRKFLGSVVLALFAGGCVSNAVRRDLEETPQQRIQKLEAQNAQCAAERQRLLEELNRAREGTR